VLKRWPHSDQLPNRLTEQYQSLINEKNQVIAQLRKIIDCQGKLLKAATGILTPINRKTTAR